MDLVIATWAMVSFLHKRDAFISSSLSCRVIALHAAVVKHVLSMSSTVGTCCWRSLVYLLAYLPAMAARFLHLAMLLPCSFVFIGCPRRESMPTAISLPPSPKSAREPGSEASKEGVSPSPSHLRPCRYPSLSLGVADTPIEDS